MKRDAAYIQQFLQETKSHQILTSRDTIIQFPKRFIERDMGEIGLETFIFGVYAVIIDDRYAVSAIPAILKTSPSEIKITEIDGDEYYNFHYPAGSVLIENSMLVKKATLVYGFMEEFFLKGNIPWYINYEDLGRLFDKAKHYSGSDVAQNYAIMEAMAAYVSRSPKDRSIHYRHYLKTKDDLKFKPQYIGMYGNVFYAAPGTVAKLSGSYFQDGVVSAITQPSEKSSKVETLLRA